MRFSEICYAISQGWLVASYFHPDIYAKIYMAFMAVAHLILTVIAMKGEDRNNE